ncbi:hypothetical protein EXIGLDRAFT_577262, partial [Exidia glandulosa HHB12029]
GLFSAVVTSFLIDSYKLLQPQPQQPNDIVIALRALVLSSNNSAAIRSLSASQPAPAVTPPHIVLVINVFWFTSLFLSLATALLCILVKQWLDEYSARTRASSQNPKHWARRRAFYFRGIDTWGINGIISLLPLLLHSALFLFFGGIVALLWFPNRTIA